jgi:hypothetical protein
MDGHKPVGIVGEAGVFMEPRRVAAPVFHRRDDLLPHRPVELFARKTNQAVDPAAAPPWLRVRVAKACRNAAASQWPPVTRLELRTQHKEALPCVESLLPLRSGTSRRC